MDLFHEALHRALDGEYPLTDWHRRQAAKVAAAHQLTPAARVRATGNHLAAQNDESEPRLEHIPGDTRPGLHMDTLGDVPDALRDELQALADSLKTQQAQPTRREATGPFPIVFAPPERMPQPYVLVKAGGAA